MDIREVLIARRTLALLSTEMLGKAGRDLQRLGRETTARLVYAVMYLQQEQVSQIDQALALLDGKTVETVRVDSYCKECKQPQEVVATINVLATEDGLLWEPTNCLGCGTSLGAIRNDAPSVPVPFELCVVDIANAPKDMRTVRELQEEVGNLIRKNTVKEEELPPVDDLIAGAIGVSAAPAAAGVPAPVRSAARDDIREKLERGRQRLQQRAMPASALFDF
jgi:hypothetical protein